VLSFPFLAVLVTVGSLVFAVPATVLFGLPVYIFFGRRGWTSLPKILGGATVSGSVSVLTFSVYSQFLSPNWYYISNKKLFENWAGFYHGLEFAYFVLPVALFVGLLFWVIAFWKPEV
jgi:hypothetical protein